MNKLGIRLPTNHLSHTLQKGEFCALGMTLYAIELFNYWCLYGKVNMFIVSTFNTLQSRGIHQVYFMRYNIAFSFLDFLGGNKSTDFITKTTKQTHSEAAKYKQVKSKSSSTKATPLYTNSNQSKSQKATHPISLITTQSYNYKTKLNQ